MPSEKENSVSQHLHRQLSYIGLVAVLVLIGAGLFKLINSSGSQPSNSQSVTVYKWQDGDGTWHFSWEKPLEAYEEVVIHDPMRIKMDKPAPKVSLFSDDNQDASSAKKRSFLIKDKGGPYSSSSKSSQRSNDESEEEWGDADGDLIQRNQAISEQMQGITDMVNKIQGNDHK